MDSTNGCNRANAVYGNSGVMGSQANTSQIVGSLGMQFGPYPGQPSCLNILPEGEGAGVMGSHPDTSQIVGTLGMQFQVYPTTMSGTVRMREEDNLEATNKVQRLEETAIDLNCHEFKLYRYQALRIFIKYIDTVKVGGDQTEALELFKSGLTELTVATADNRFSKYQSAVVDEISDILNDIRSKRTN